MLQTAKNVGIDIVGISSDGDTRLLKCMIYKTIATTCSWDWFQSLMDPEMIFVQDHVHIGAKLKTRLLRPSGVLPFGKYHVASRGHLAELISTISKDHHELTSSFLNTYKGQNEITCCSKIDGS